MKNFVKKKQMINEFKCTHKLHNTGDVHKYHGKYRFFIRLKKAKYGQSCHDWSLSGKSTNLVKNTFDRKSHKGARNIFDIRKAKWLLQVLQDLKDCGQI